MPPEVDKAFSETAVLHVARDGGRGDQTHSCLDHPYRVSQCESQGSCSRINFFEDILNPQKI